MEKLAISLRVAHYPLARAFTISRGSKNTAHAVHVELRSGDAWGKGAIVPYLRYGESVAGVLEELGTAAKQLTAAITPAQLNEMFPAGATRAVLDAALLDLRAKQAGKRVWEMLGLPEPKAVTSVYTTISLDTPDAMAQQAQGLDGILKIKLGGSAADEAARLQAVAAAAPNASFIIDPNEGWSAETLRNMLPEIAKIRAIAIEQPLPSDADEALLSIHAPCPIFADESVHVRSHLGRTAGRYQGINIKLGKAGGLTEALALKQSAQRMGLKVMVGCQVECSLASAPAFLVAQGADIIELDGPRLLAVDSQPELIYEDSMLYPYGPELWG